VVLLACLQQQPFSPLIFFFFVSVSLLFFSSFFAFVFVEACALLAALRRLVFIIWLR
jgi:hypothetical protein